MNDSLFERQLAYQIGVKLAFEQHYLEKEASWQNVGKGIKSFATGGGWTGAGGAGAGKAFGATMKDLGGHIKKPWQEMYKTYGARTGVKTLDANKATIAKAREAVTAAKASKDPTKITQANKALQDAESAALKSNRGVTDALGYGSNPMQIRTDAARSYVPRHAPVAGTPAGTPGAVNWEQAGTMAAGAGLAAGAGYGAYNLGRTAMGGSSQPQPRPQPQQAAQAPHEYYMKQWFG